MSHSISGVLRPPSFNREILRTIVVVGSLGAVAKLAVLLKEVVVARSFGRSDAVDAFLIAFLLPSVVINIVTSGIGIAAIPVLVARRANGESEQVRKLCSNMLWLVAIVLGGIGLLLAESAPLYLHHLAYSFPWAKLQLTRHLLYFLLGWMVLFGISTVFTAILNAMKSFALPALVPLVTPAMVIVATELAARRWGAYALAAGTLLGAVIECGLLLGAVIRKGIRIAPRWFGNDQALRDLLAQYFPLLVGGILFCSMPLVDQSMAAMLPAGSVSALGYANKVIIGIVGLTVTSLSTAILPYFSQMVLVDDRRGYRRTLRLYSALVLAVSMPATLLLAAFAGPLTRFLFQRGEFTAADSVLVSRVIMFYAFQIPFQILIVLFSRFLAAARRNELLLYGGAISLALDIVLNLLLMRRLGVAGIALSTSIVSALAAAYVLWQCGRVLRQSLAPLAFMGAAGGTMS
jgi:putative peptidoglycan lipid II flippase